MELKFSKYHGTGNDFIIVDGFADPNIDQGVLSREVANLCNRRFGIGADGLIIIMPHKEYDFEMIYYNSDGNQSSMCGNGGRCIVHFAFTNSYVGENCRFLAVDGPHVAKANVSEVSLQMGDVHTVSKDGSAYVLDTGSPHYVYLSNIPSDEAFKSYAKEIRFGAKYGSEGININCLEQKEGSDIHVLTYERGVEDITYSCGTGVVAAAITQAIESGKETEFQSSITTKGGVLHVQGIRKKDSFQDLWLRGPAKLVFEGTINLQSAHPDFPRLH